MMRVDFSFIIDLESYFFKTWFKGPLFHKWLPNNDESAIILQAFRESIKIKVWFERRGVMKDKQIFYDDQKKKNTIDSTRISKQYILSGGHLFGSFEMADITQEELEVMTQNLQGNDLYVNLGKRVAKMLAPPIIIFVDLLRINYGQYWLRPFHKWDSQKQSIGSYCRRILLRWKTENDNIWHDFIPNKLVDKITFEIWGDDKYLSYLNGEDWEDIKKLVQTDFKPDLALEILNRAHEEWDHSNYSRAVTDAITALEIAMDKRLKKVNESNNFQTQINKFDDKWDLDTKIFVIFNDLVPKETLFSAIQCIKLRNQIVHEGVRAHKTDKELFLGIKSCIKSIYPQITLKFPSIGAKQIIEK